MTELWQRTLTAAAAVFAIHALAWSIAADEPAAAPPALPAAAHTIVIDARLDDWAHQEYIAADDEYVYLRLVTGKPLSLQTSDHTYVLRIDLDADLNTGRRAAWHADESMGVDLEVQFSPNGRQRSTDHAKATLRENHAIRVVAQGRNSTPLDLTLGDIDLMYAPTYLASEFELRFSRELSERLAGIEFGSTLRAAFVARPPPPDVDRIIETFELAIPAAETGSVNGDLPARAAGSLRVVSYNVLNTATVTRAPSFGRILRALQPDILLLQEWPRGGPASEGWFREHVDPNVTWHALSGHNVAIVSRFELSPAFTAGDRGEPRVVAARVKTPDGPLLVVSTHLKCCGGPTGREEMQRQHETQWINDRLRKLQSAERLPLIVGGDMNLVGTRKPLELLSAQLDVEGRNLQIADGLTIGDTAFYTWRDYALGYSPARLDWLLYSGSSLTATSSFSVDTGRIAPETLKRADIRPDDGLASDHLPMVLDIRRD